MKFWAYKENSYFFVRGTLSGGGQAVAVYASGGKVPQDLLDEWTNLKIPVYQLQGKGLNKDDAHGEMAAERASGQWSSVDDALSTNGICARCVAAANNFISSSGLQVQKGSAGIANGEVVKTPTGGRFFPDTQNIYSAGAEGDAGAAGDAGADFLGPLGFILQAIAAQRNGGFYSQGGCEVFGVPPIHVPVRSAAADRIAYLAINPPPCDGRRCRTPSGSVTRSPGARSCWSARPRPPSSKAWRVGCGWVIAVNIAAGLVSWFRLHGSQPNQ